MSILNHSKSGLALFFRIEKNLKISHASSGHGNMAMYDMRFVNFSSQSHVAKMIISCSY